MQNVGICLKNYIASEVAWRLINKANEQSKNINTTFFFQENIGFCVDPLSSCMNICEAFNYEHPIITTELITAQKLLKFPSPSVKILYVYDLEWMYLRPHFVYSEVKNIYRNEELMLIARNVEYSDILKNIWNLDYAPLVVDNADIGKILELCDEKNKKNSLNKKVLTGRILG